MRHYYTILAVLFCFDISAQDTISVQTFTYDTISTRRATFDFPSTLQGETFEKVLLYYNLKCSPLTPWDSYNCGEWDYLANTTIFNHTGVNDSVKKEIGRYWVNGEYLNNVSYSNSLYYNYFENYQYFINYSAQADNDYLVGTGVDQSSHPFGTSNQNQHTQMLWTASELSTAGVVAGNIDKLRFDISSDGGEMGHLTIKIKHSNLTDLSGFENTGWSTVYDLNTDFAATGWQSLNLTYPFNYDGTSNVLIDIAYENDNTGNDNIINASVTTNNSVVVANDKQGYLNVNPGEFVNVDLDDYDFQDEITISFWANGDANYLPANTSILEGRDSLNNRILNIHLPWSNSTFYWDVGEGNGNDRIQKGASVSEIEGEWNHWAFTKNVVSGIMNIYKNGVLWHTGSNLNREIGIVNMFKIGTSITGNFNYGGKIDEFRIWNSEIDAATITDWMTKKIDNSHPNYTDLLVYYDFDNESTVQDRTNNDIDGMMTETDMIQFNETLPVGHEVSTIRPNITFVQGTYTAIVDSLLVVDSVMVTPIDVLEYAVDGRKFIIDDIIQAYPVGYSYTYDHLGNKTADSVWFGADLTITNDSVVYYEAPFELVEEFEIGRFITPYGIGFDLGPSGFTWVYDVTDYQGLLLTDLVDLRAHNTQELIDLRFDFITGTPPREVKSVERLWQNYGNHKYGDIDDDTDLSEFR